MKEVYFTQGKMAGQVRTIADDHWGFIRDDKKIRWHYVLQEDGWMKLIWNGTIQQWNDQDVFRKVLFQEIK